MVRKKKKRYLTCPDCGVVRFVYLASLSQHKRCRSCAQKIEKNKPELIAKVSLLARKQVLRQGGVPNAVHLTRERVTGEANINWKGGVTPEHIKLRNNNDRRIWVKAVFKRDDYTCQICKARGGKLHSHHIKTFAAHPELRYDIDNGVTLCVDCHIQIVHRGNPRTAEPMTLTEIRELQSMPVTIDWEPSKSDLTQ